MTFSTDEGAARCPIDSRPSARVEDHEELALIVSHPFQCDTTGRPNEGAFPFSQLLMTSRDTAQYPHDCCGHSEGVSLRRTDTVDGMTLMVRSANLAQRQGANATPMGGAIAVASVLRGLRLGKPATSARPGAVEIATADQIAFVLTDGGPGNEQHAVLRLHPQADRTIGKQVREKLMRAFEPHSIWLGRQNQAP